MLGAQGEPVAAGGGRRTFAQAPAPASPARQTQQRADPQGQQRSEAGQALRSRTGLPAATSNAAKVRTRVSRRVTSSTTRSRVRRCVGVSSVTP